MDTASNNPSPDTLAAAYRRRRVMRALTVGIALMNLLFACGAVAHLLFKIADLFVN